MSAREIPYHLRPNKFVDRQIFFELLSRVIPPEAPESYVYMSMGGKFLTDHARIHQALGIRHLFSFDGNSYIVDRQRFNRPYGFVRCEHMESSEFVNSFETIVSDYPDTSRFIVWLDFTSADRALQLGELQHLVSKLSAYDIVRVTLNANLETIVSNRKKIPKGFESKSEHRLEVFKEKLGEFIDNPTKDQMEKETFSYALSNCIKRALHKGCRGTNNLKVKPLNINEYADGATMLTATAILLPRGQITKYFQRQSLKSWKPLSKTWNDIKRLRIPDLSVRERQKIDSKLETSAPSRIASTLGFDFGGLRDTSIEQIRSYKTYARYYPHFSRVEY